MEGLPEKKQTRKSRSNEGDKDDAGVNNSSKGVTVEQLTVKTSSMNLKPSNDKVRIKVVYV